ncbi:MAG: helix-turn-helix transcriptional regulator [Clostridia bacterium]|nr:helix-turn-helix transcriptional regulator [Clostridia bacterium]
MKVFVGISEKKLGEILKKYRTEYGYTQKKLADYLGIDRTTYTKYETVRKPEIDVIMRLAAFYNVSVEDFLDEFFVDGKKETKTAYVSAPAKKELMSLTEDEKQLIGFYRDALRKEKIFEDTKNVWLEDKGIVSPQGDEE